MAKIANVSMRWGPHFRASVIRADLMEVFVAMAPGRNVKWERNRAGSIPGNALYNCHQVYFLPRNTVYDSH